LHFGLKLRLSKEFVNNFPDFNSTKTRTLFQKNSVDISGNYWSIPGPAVKQYLESQINMTKVFYYGDVFALIGPKTFSSAQLIAETIHDNHFGYVIGEPTGSAVNYFGYPITFSFPVPEMVDYNFTVSSSQFIRPDTSLPNDNTLQPDVLYSLDADNIKNNSDPQMWVAMIKEKKET